MIRLLNLLAVAGLVASAIYAYSIKYDTLYQGGQVSKLKTALHAERQAIAVLRAEWQLLTRPDRLQAAVDKHLALEPIGTSHLARLPDLPVRPERGDEIGRLLAATATPRDKGGPEPRTTGAITRTVTTTRTPKSGFEVVARVRRRRPDPRGRSAGAGTARARSAGPRRVRARGPGA